MMNSVEEYTRSVDAFNAIVKRSLCGDKVTIEETKRPIVKLTYGESVIVTEISEANDIEKQGAILTILNEYDEKETVYLTEVVRDDRYRIAECL